eukprot:gene8647-10644_t
MEIKNQLDKLLGIKDDKDLGTFITDRICQFIMEKCANGLFLMEIFQGLLPVQLSQRNFEQLFMALSNILFDKENHRRILDDKRTVSYGILTYDNWILKYLSENEPALCLGSPNFNRILGQQRYALVENNLRNYLSKMDNNSIKSNLPTLPLIVLEYILEILLTSRFRNGEDFRWKTLGLALVSKRFFKKVSELLDSVEDIFRDYRFKGLYSVGSSECLLKRYPYVNNLVVMGLSNKRDLELALDDTRSILLDDQDGDQYNMVLEYFKEVCMDPNHKRLQNELYRFEISISQDEDIPVISEFLSMMDGQLKVIKINWSLLTTSKLELLIKVFLPKHGPYLKSVYLEAKYKYSDIFKSIDEYRERINPRLNFYFNGNPIPLASSQLRINSKGLPPFPLEKVIISNNDNSISAPINYQQLHKHVKKLVLKSFPVYDLHNVIMNIHDQYKLEMIDHSNLESISIKWNYYFQLFGKEPVPRDKKPPQKEERTKLRIPKGLLPETGPCNLNLVITTSDDEDNLSGVLEPGSIPLTIGNLQLDHRLFSHDPLNLIPPSVTDIVINSFQSTVRLKMEIYQIVLDLPLSLIHISPGGIPESVRVLSCGIFISHMAIENGTIPNGLQAGIFPPTITEIIAPYEMECSFLRPGISTEMLTKISTNEDITSQTRFPPYLEHLECRIIVLKINFLTSHGHHFYYPLIPIGGIPESTQYLSLGNNFNPQPLTKGILPEKLKTMSMDFRSVRSDKQLYIPDSVSTLIFLPHYSEKKLKKEEMGPFFEEFLSRSREAPHNQNRIKIHIFMLYQLRVPILSKNTTYYPIESFSLSFHNTFYLEKFSLKISPYFLKWDNSPLVNYQFWKLPDDLTNRITTLEIVYNSNTPSSTFTFITQCINLEKTIINYLSPKEEGDGKGLKKKTKLRIPKGLLPETGPPNLTLDIITKNVYDLSKVLEPGSIPLTIGKLQLDHRLFSHDPLNLIPPSVTDIVINSFQSTGDNKPIVPNTVKKLVLHPLGNLSTIENGNLPDSITDLNLPLSLIHISSGGIPNSVKVLNCGKYISKMDLENGTIPNGVEILKFGRYIDTYRTCGRFGSKNKPLKSKFKGLQTGMIPPTVIEIMSPLENNCFLRPGISPEMLTKIFTNEEITSETRLPPCLEYLECRILVLKITILSLSINYSYYPSIPIGGIPESTQYLSLGNHFDQPLTKGILPKSLKTLALGDFTSVSGDKQLFIPDSVTTIKFHLLTSYRPKIKKEEIGPFIQKFLSCRRGAPYNKNRIQIQIFGLYSFISFDENDKYCYLVDTYYSEFDKFILKSNLNSNSTFNIFNNSSYKRKTIM